MTRKFIAKKINETILGPEEYASNVPKIIDRTQDKFPTNPSKMIAFNIDTTDELFDEVLDKFGRMFEWSGDWMVAGIDIAEKIQNYVEKQGGSYYEMPDELQEVRGFKTPMADISNDRLNAAMKDFDHSIEILESRYVKHDPQTQRSLYYTLSYDEFEVAFVMNEVWVSHLGDNGGIMIDDISETPIKEFDREGFKEAIAELNLHAEAMAEGFMGGNVDPSGKPGSSQSPPMEVPEFEGKDEELDILTRDEDEEFDAMLDAEEDQTEAIKNVIRAILKKEGSNQIKKSELKTVIKEVIQEMYTEDEFNEFDDDPLFSQDRAEDMLKNIIAQDRESYGEVGDFESYIEQMEQNGIDLNIVDVQDLYNVWESLGGAA